MKGFQIACLLLTLPCALGQALFSSRLPKSRDAKDYQLGEIVCWNLGGGITHIGMISGEKVPSGNRDWMIHNIGAGQVQ